MLFLLSLSILLANTTADTNQYNSSFISATKAEMENNMLEELKKEMVELKKTMGAWLEDKEKEIRRELQDTKRELALSVKESVRDLPYVMFCAYQKDWAANSTIAFNHFISNYNNADRPGNKTADSARVRELYLHVSLFVLHNRNILPVSTV